MASRKDSVEGNTLTWTIIYIIRIKEFIAEGIEEYHKQTITFIYKRSKKHVIFSIKKTIT